MINHLLSIGLILCFGYHVHASIPGEFSVLHFNQKVDHFNYLNNETFKQRVVIASANYKLEDSPPIFLYCGNEGDIFAFVNNTGLMWEIQDKFKAVLIFIEHRYYGTSFPERTSKNDYKYLSIEQAITDFAVIIDELRNTHKNLINSPVIGFGGSYGGMLAAWMRIKYPHLIEGAIAGSAPIIQFPGAYNCSDFQKIVTKDYEGYSSDCANVIRKTWPAIRRLGKTEGGLQFLKQTFQLCKPITAENLTDLINYFSNIIVNVAMVDYPNEANFLKPMPRYPMKEICKILETDQLDDPDLVKSFKEGFYSIYMNYTGNSKCVNIKEDSTDLGAEGWDYQSCTETIMPICSDGINDFFEVQKFDLETITADCLKKYNVKPDPNKVRMEYGLRDLRMAKNIVFSNGERDPWSAGGVLISNYERFGLKKLEDSELNKTIADYFGEQYQVDKKKLKNIVFTNGPIILNIPNACHHEDLRETGKHDPDELIEARKQEIKIIKKWLKDYYKVFQ